MKLEHPAAWTRTESHFAASDGTRLFFRAWQPAAPASAQPPRALVFLHRGHEHSGRVAQLVERFGRVDDWAFAHDARGHGHTPGPRGDAPDFATLVSDLDTFVRHIVATYGIAIEDIVVVGNSVGAVVASTWIHDYAPRIRGVILAAAAFEIKLYVPLAKPALRFARRFKPDLTVTSYIRPSMLTHSKEEAAAYAADPLITKTISAKILLDLADTAERIVKDAAAIDVPVLMLVADRDAVVSEAPQKLFFERLSSASKKYVRLTNCFHAIFYEQDTAVAMQASQAFIADCYAAAPLPAAHYLGADRAGASAVQYAALQRGDSTGTGTRAWFGLQRRMLSVMGPLSDGMKIGLKHGFDSGESLDYVYRNEAGGKFGFGKQIDRGYLDAIGWRGVRIRKAQLQKMLGERIAACPREATVRILDIAAGPGRYVLETVQRHDDRKLDVTLRDAMQYNIDHAQQLVTSLALHTPVRIEQRDAFSLDSYAGQEGQYDIVVVSGLYELFSDNAMVARSLKGAVASLREGGHLIYTAQPWHPQLDMIALTLVNHRGTPWQMRARSQAEMDALVSLAGAAKVETAIGLDGIFTVSLARKGATPGAGG
jgi:alpha-beta hydrolase superfamily lysophospholipase/SAM-dependent methyltransferase